MRRTVPLTFAALGVLVIAALMIATLAFGASAQNDASAPRDCDRLDRFACMASTECTLRASDGGNYVCEESRGACEVDIAQADLMSAAGRDRCEARTSCEVQAPTCYCACGGYGETSVPDPDDAPTCRCRCAHGGPPACAPSP